MTRTFLRLSLVAGVAVMNACASGSAPPVQPDPAPIVFAQKMRWILQLEDERGAEPRDLDLHVGRHLHDRPFRDSTAHRWRSCHRPIRPQRRPDHSHVRRQRQLRNPANRRLLDGIISFIGALADVLVEVGGVF